MLTAKLTISYDRGMERNRAEDVVLTEGQEKAAATAKIARRGDKTADGKVVRGLGTHYISEAEMQLHKERSAEDGRIRTAFRQRFPCTAIDGLYVVPSKGVAAEFVKGLGVRDNVRVYVQEYEIFGDPSDSELAEWSERLKRQFANVRLGRTSEADEEGLNCLEFLSRCPIISRGTGARIREMVEMVRGERMTRVEIKRALDDLKVEINTAELEPQVHVRRAPVA